MRLADRQSSRAARIAGRLDSGCRARHLILSSLAVLWVAGSSADTAARGAPVSWSPAHLAASVASGATQTTVVTFTSAIDLSNIAVDIVPALRPYVHASPSHIAQVAAGIPVEVTLTLSAPVGTAPGTIEGTLKLRPAGGPPRTHPLPLPITLTITPDEPGDGLVVSGRVLFDSGGPVAGAIVRGSLASEEAIEAVQVVRQEQRALVEPTPQTAKNGSVFADARVTASPVLPTSVPAETLTAADGSFAIDLGPAALPVRVRVEVSFQPDSLPRVDVAKWEVALNTTLDMGTIVLPDPIGAEMPVAGGAAESADGSVKVAGLPPEVDRLFARAFDPDESPEAFPGEFAEMGAIPLNSSLFLWMEALDAQGNPVDDLAQAATIRARVPRSQWGDLEDIDSGTDRIEIPIYFFNEATSMWEQMGIGWLEDDQGSVLTEVVQAPILDGSFPREIFATFTTMHLSWMNVDYAYLGPWTLSRMSSLRRNDDCFFEAVRIASVIARSAKAQAVFAACVQPGKDLQAIFADAEGPEIKTGVLPPNASVPGAWGWFSGEVSGDEFHLSDDMWTRCQTGATELDRKHAAMNMAITILHETAHWLCFTEGVEEQGFEAGTFVENLLFGRITTDLDDGVTRFVPSGAPVPEATLDAWADRNTWPPPPDAPLLQRSAIGPLQASSPLNLTIALQQETFELGEEIVVAVTYTNVSAAPLTIPDFIVLEGSPLAFEIRRVGESQRVPFVGVRMRLSLGPEDFVTLDPGAPLSKTVGLLRGPQGGPHYGPIGSGEYEVTAIFSSLWGVPEARSNTLTFSVGAGGRIAGIVTDAANARPVAGATVTAVLNGSVVATATTGPDGAYVLANLPPGVYGIDARAPAYVLAVHENVPVAAGQTTTVNINLSTVIPPGELRIVLSWDTSIPEDPRAHLWLPAATPYHIFFARRGDLTTCPFASWDRDVVSGVVFETITITQRFAGTYIHAVSDSSFDGMLAGSGAQVQVFDSTGLLATLTVPAHGTGDWWHVLTIDGATGAITVINEIGGDPRPYLDTAAGCPVGN